MTSILDKLLAIIEIVPVSAAEVTAALRSCFSETTVSNLLAGIAQAGAWAKSGIKCVKW